MTTTVTYTHFFDDFDSSLVDSVAYDSVTQAAFVDLNDEVYRYDKVPFADVEALVQAPSVGRAFNGSFMSKGFKQKFGPGTHLGNWAEIEYEERDKAANASPSYTFNITAPTSSTGLSNPGGAKNLTYASGAVVDGQPVNTTTNGPVRVNLKAEPEKVAEVTHIPLKREEETKQAERKFTVHFESNGPKTYNVEGTDFDSAIAKLHEAAEVLGVDVKVTGVFLHLV